MDLSIVTSVTPNYHRYLPEWAAAIAAQTVTPAHVGLLDNGIKELRPRHVETARRILDAAGITLDYRRVARCDFGRARNLAVGMSETEWVMHADADDVLLPGAVAEIARVAPVADVVCLAYERFASGGRSFVGKPIGTYRATRGMSTLLSVAPASGLSPFRRSLWRQSPYVEDGLEGGWDTALWLGFAHLGARFVPTEELCFRYRQHVDSVFQRRRRDPRKTARVSLRFEQIRWGRDVTVCVPFRPDGAERDAAWSWTERWWAQHFPGWEIIVSDSEGEEWCKPEALNRAVARATGRTLVLADADSFCDPRALLAAVRAVWSHDAWCIPHYRVLRLNESETARLLTQGPRATPSDNALARAAYRGTPGGGLVVLKRDAWPGHDERFTGWGGDDDALGHLLGNMLGPAQRLDADLWHLWHPEAEHTRLARNRELLNDVYRARPIPPRVRR